jgi:hypothetical protein
MEKAKERKVEIEKKNATIGGRDESASWIQEAERRGILLRCETPPYSRDSPDSSFSEED